MTVVSSTLAAADTRSADSLLLTDFTGASPDLGWYVVNDNVMGGRSEGDFGLNEGQLEFAGRTNTNGGGFSSIRTKSLRLDLSDFTGIRLYVMGDGRRYTWRLTTNARWRGREVAYWAEFDTLEDIWTTIDIPFSRFEPRFRGTRLSGPALDAGQITGMGLMIYDNEDGPFRLRLDSVQGYGREAPFALEQYEWEKRVLVVSAPGSDDRDLREQQRAIALTAAEFEDRDMLLATLLDNGGSTVGDRQLSTEEVARTRAQLGIEPGAFALRLIGKDGTVKLSGGAATPMAKIYALIDTMPMRRREQSGSGE